MAKMIKPDLKFVQEIIASGGGSLKRCYQCATCSVQCSLSPEKDPFPRKEMIKAQWGMREELLASPDVWLCHQCGDCSAYCPRGARPSDVLAAIRRLAIVHYAFPGFWARWVNQPKFLPFLILIPTMLLVLAMVAIDPIKNSFGFGKQVGGQIVYASTTLFPHWFLNIFFLSISTLSFAAVFVGAVRFWRAMKAADGDRAPVKGIVASAAAALRKILTHDSFASCTTERTRLFSHMCVFLGFAALSVVTIWVISIPINPLLGEELVYPFNFWNPLKIIANIGGGALILGCVLMIWRRAEQDAASTYFDWVFILTLLTVGVTGFMTEVLHYARVDDLRYPVYFAHLVFIIMLIAYLPYSKFGHVIYRTAALIYAEYSGRSGGDIKSDREDI